MQNGFVILKKSIIEELLKGQVDMVFDLIKRAYRLHGERQTNNPPSYFLKFSHKENARIIALPGYLGGDFNVAGIKWVSSFPDNIKHGFQRASAVFILNDAETGYPLACMESSYISALRTAVSAVLAAEQLHNHQITNKSLAVIGTGFIAKKILEIFYQRGWTFKEVYLFDNNENDANKFKKNVVGQNTRTILTENADTAISQADTVVFATTAATPYVKSMATLKHAPIVLHISLRDLSVDIIANSINYVDDIEHVLHASTSVDLAFQKLGHHNFINGTIVDLLKNNTVTKSSKPIIFSPMGMGILDLAIANFLYEKAMEQHSGLLMNDFFGDISR